MSQTVFARNPKEHAIFSSLHMAIVGLGTIGGALVDILVRTGVGRLTLIDPEDFAAENVGRHILGCRSVSKSKAHELALHIAGINPDCRVEARQERFESLPERPDLILCAADGFQCASLVNGYALAENVPAVFSAVWGEASIAEILYVIPGKTPCYECYAGFRRNVEISSDARRYTDPNFDDTRVPGQAGLWANILMLAGLEFQVILGLVGLRNTLDCRDTLWLMNISDPRCGLQRLALTLGEVKKGCAVCDRKCLDELLAKNVGEPSPSPALMNFDPSEKMLEDTEEASRSSAEMPKKGIFI